VLAQVIVNLHLAEHIQVQIFFIYLKK